MAPAPTGSHLPSIQEDAVPASTTQPWGSSRPAKGQCLQPACLQVNSEGAVAAVMTEQEWFLTPVSLTGHVVYEWEGFRQQ